MSMIQSISKPRKIIRAGQINAIAKISISRRLAVVARISAKPKRKRGARSRRGSMAAIRVHCRPADRPTLAEVLAAYRRQPAHRRRKRMRSSRLCERSCRANRLGNGESRIFGASIWTNSAGNGREIAANRNLAFLRAMCNWAVVEKLLPFWQNANGEIEGGSPFRVGNVPVVKLTARGRPIAPATRRRGKAAVGRGEGAAGSDRRGARDRDAGRGELLSLQWHQVRFTPRRRSVPAGGEDESEEARRVPISSGAADVLDARRHDPAGEPCRPRRTSLATDRAPACGRSRRAWGRRVGARRSPTCTSTICDARPARAGWMPACRWRRFSGGSGTTTSARRRRIWRASLGGDERRNARVRRADRARIAIDTN